MPQNIEKLVSISSPAICSNLPRLSSKLISIAGGEQAALTRLLTLKNGFYAFERALHVLPSQCPNASMNLERWNSESLWKNDYGEITNEYVFFAEDIFGEQFAMSREGIFRFNPETADYELIAESLEDWAGIILEDYEVETGYAVASQWQELNGSISLGQRLLPKIPFVLGGDYEIENLYALDAIQGMRLRADIWNQIKDLPEGAKVELKVINR